MNQQANTKEAKKPTQEKKEKRPTAQKRIIQSEKRQLINRSFKSKVRTAIRSLRESVENKETKAATEEKLRQIYSLMDKGAKSNIFKKNKASRIKSRLSLLASKSS